MKVWKVILAAVVIFLTGAITGGFVVEFFNVRLLTPVEEENESASMPRGLDTKKLLHRMRWELDLTDEQAERIREILKESTERMRQLWEPVKPKAHEEFMRTIERIKEVLNEEQREEFEEIMRRGPDRDKQRRDKYDDGKPGPPSENRDKDFGGIERGGDNYRGCRDIDPGIWAGWFS
ncbi:MAG: hypothetical protein K9N52_00375 [Verrucomicrobia bacterium]|nr:hypothetical protein [Verrucomicrobiota bacterium]